MSNINLEAISEDIDLNILNRSAHNVHQPVSANPTKKRSGFQITSVKDSDHGRPASIVHDGEESADDLDESHASYSDVSLSRTEADHDPESAASEDTLNTSVHEAPNLELNHINSLHNTHHGHHPSQPPKSGPGHEGNAKHRKEKDTNIDSVNLQQAAVVIPKTPLKKQLSEQLDVIQDLPLDNVPADSSKENKSNGTEKKVSLPQSTSANVKVTPPSVLSDQSLNSKATVPSSNISTATVSQQSRAIYSPDSADTYNFPEKTNATTSGAAAAQNSKPATVSNTAPSSKAPGTRVYKVVKRETAQPTKKIRGRWNCHEYSDTQSPITGVANPATSVERRLSNHTLTNLTYTNSLISSLHPYHQSTSYFQQQLFSANLSNSMSSSTRHEKSVMSLGADDVLKSAINRYTAGTSGDAATGDTSVANQTQKIDNKIEAAMDLVKKHLMSAVRDEVDELKEKIKDLSETITNLNDETSRLKAENKELRSKLPAEVAAQVQTKVNQSPPKDTSSNTSQDSGEHKVSGNNTASTEASSITPSTLDLLPQKGVSTSLGKEESSTHMSSLRSNDHKVKIVNPNPVTTQAIQSTQRQDAQKIPVSKATSMTGQPSHNTPVHMQKTTITNTSQPTVESHMQEHGHMPNQENLKITQRNVDHNFERNNPS